MNNFVLRGILFFFLTLCVITQINDPAVSQTTDITETKLTLLLSDTPLKSALAQITQHTNISFAYNEKLISEIDVKGNFEQASLSYILDSILKNHSLFYSVTASNEITISEQKYPKLKSSIISGKVTSLISGEPLPGVNVYFNNTTTGTTTDENGFYTIFNIPLGTKHLVISSVSYKPVTKIIKVSQPDYIEVNAALEENVEELREIVVVGESAKTKARNYKKFVESFIGKSKNAKDTEIHNPESLILNYDDGLKLLTAQAKEPLLVENRSLGYRLHFSLQDFKALDKDVDFKGTILFEYLDSENGKERQTWEKNRAATYKGSLQHFLKTIAYGESFKGENFKVFNAGKYELQYKPGTNRRLNTSVFLDSKKWDMNGQLRSLQNGSSLVRYTDSQEEIQLAFNDLIEVQYRNKGNASVIQLNGDYATFTRRGQLLDPYAITVTGKWAKNKVADILPYEYDPDLKEQPVVNEEENNPENLLDYYRSADLGMNENKISDAIQYFLNRYNELSKKGKHDPGTGLGFLELVTSYKMENLYSIASEMYTWGVSGELTEESLIDVENEIKMILPLLEPSLQEEWKILLQNTDNQILTKLRRFWALQDPIPSTIKNERLIEHWSRIHFARENFTKNITTVYGTDDRGSVYVRYGLPDKMIKDKFVVSTERAEKINPYIRAVRQHKLYVEPEFDLWIYKDLVNGDTVRYFFGPEFGYGDYGVRYGVENFINPKAFRENGRIWVFERDDSLGSFLQWYYYKYLQDYDDYYYYIFLELERFVGVLGTSETNMKRYVYEAHDKNDPAKRKAVKETSIFDSRIRDLDVAYYVTRILDDNNAPALGIIAYVLPEGNGGARKQLIYDFATGNDYDMYNTLTLTDKNWNEIKRMTDAPSARKTNFSSFIAPHLADSTTYLLASIASEILNDSTKAPSDTLFGQLAGNKVYLDNLPLLSSDLDVLEVSDLLLGQRITEVDPDADIPFIVLPDHTVEKGQSLHVYFEIYHLMLGGQNNSEYTVTYKIESQDKPGILKRILGSTKDKDITSQQYISSSQSRRTEELIELDISVLEPGDYQLTIDIIDNLSGQTKSRNVLFKIIG